MSDVTATTRRTRPEMSGPVLGMVLFVASEAMFFAAFFGGYFTIKANAPEWPPPGTPHLKIEIATLLTVILVISSVTVQLSLRSIRGGNRSRSTMWLGITILLGVCFLALQLYDYSQLGFGLKDGVFGTLFYVMTGIHMAHVIGGVVFLALVFASGPPRAALRHPPRSARGRRHLLGLRRRRVAVPVHRLLPADPEVIA